MAIDKLTKDMAIIQKLDDETNDVLLPGIPRAAVCAVTLTASGWNTATKQQTVTVAGVLAGDSGQLVTPYPADDSSYTAYGIANTRHKTPSIRWSVWTTLTALPTVKGM